MVPCIKSYYVPVGNVHVMYNRRYKVHVYNLFLTWVFFAGACPRGCHDANPLRMQVRVSAGGDHRQHPAQKVHVVLR